MKNIMRNASMPVVFGVAALILGAIVYAASTSRFTLTINPGTLAIDIVDGTYNSVANPTVAFGAISSSMDCLTGANRASGTFGTATERIYIQNPDAADNGWTASLAASAPTATWAGVAGGLFDFNDATGSGCTDNGTGEADTVGGQMTVNAAAGTLATGKCVGCDTTNITLGSEDSFVQGTKDSITLVNAAAASSDIGDWTLEGVTINQTIPAGQSADDYSIDMTLSVIGA